MFSLLGLLFTVSRHFGVYFVLAKFTTEMSLYVFSSSLNGMLCLAAVLLLWLLLSLIELCGGIT